MRKRDEGVEALAIATSLHGAALRLARQLRATRASGALSNSKLMVLRLLHRNGVMTGSALAAELGVQPQSLTRLFAGLESDGLISRKPDSADRRQTLINLTARGGEALAADLLERRRRLAEAMTRVLTPAEREVLRLAAELMEKVGGAIAPAESERPSMRAAAE